MNEPFCILVVDDDPVQHEILGPMLEHEGYRVLTAHDGPEALERVRDEAVDLVLLDVRMPGMSGFDVLERLRRKHQPDRLSVIMATASDSREDIVRAFDLGANDYVTLPLDQQVTLARIQAQLRYRSPAVSRVDVRESGAIGPGAVLDGKYRIDRLIGRGNFGAVYEGTHLRLQRPVAVKILRASFGADQVSVERFRQEGVSLSRLQHPNAVAVLDYSVTDNAVTYLVMERLQGHGLERELRDRGPLDPRRAAEIVFPVCDVLSEAHALGIVHRDIKPHNIFLHRGRRGEVVKVLDFGIAKMIGESELGQQLTLEGNSVGTPAYMAPERFTNDPYDGRADVYSLAVTLYEMLAGEPPFADADGNFFKLIRMHVVEKPRALRERHPEIPEALDELVQRALSKQAEDRPTAAELARDLAAAVGIERPEPLVGSSDVESSSTGVGERSESHDAPFQPTVELRGD